MRYMLALFLPGVGLWMMKKRLQGFICMILQFSFFGWLPAAVWALCATHNYYGDKRYERLATAFEKGSQPRIV